jgi:hypothetical protein
MGDMDYDKFDNKFVNDKGDYLLVVAIALLMLMLFLELSNI